MLTIFPEPASTAFAVAALAGLRPAGVKSTASIADSTDKKHLKQSHKCERDECRCRMGGVQQDVA
jgi:hypothetical protein